VICDEDDIGDGFMDQEVHVSMMEIVEGEESERQKEMLKDLIILMKYGTMKVVMGLLINDLMKRKVEKEKEKEEGMEDGERKRKRERSGNGTQF
jgi:hypothetical protein